MSAKFKSRAFGAAFCIALAAPGGAASAAEWQCEISEPVPGGMLHLILSGSGTEVAAASGTVEMYTASAPAPLGLRNGTFAWDAPQGEIALTGGVLSLGFEANLPLAEGADWGAGDGDIIPSRLFFVLPVLLHPSGIPIQLSGVTLISGNGVYISNNNWYVRGSELGMLVSNAPELSSLVYSRELLQIISLDPAEPISLFLTPSSPGAVDSIASFHAGGLVTAPQRIVALIAGFEGPEGNCPSGAAPIAIP